jgi:hypothetical protein
MEQIDYRAAVNSRIKTFRWYFYIAAAQFLMYFIVPLMVFPVKVIRDIEIVSALTLGTVVGIFFGLVNVAGLVLDKSRRILYLIMLSIIAAYMAWVVISWVFIERMNYLLR